MEGETEPEGSTVGPTSTVPIDRQGVRIMPFSREELVGLVLVGVALAVVVGGYMVISRRKGWMRED